VDSKIADLPVLRFDVCDSRVVTSSLARATSLLGLFTIAASLIGCPAPTCDQGDTGGMLDAGQHYRAKTRCSGPDGNEGVDPDTSSGDDDSGTSGDGPDLGGGTG
jgi:hypothetical protein